MDAGENAEGVRWVDGESLSEVDSISPFATTEPQSSEISFQESGSSKDSGVIEEIARNVTNLCRSRVPASVSGGVVTDTCHLGLWWLGG